MDKHEEEELIIFLPYVKSEVNVTLENQIGPAHSYSSIVLCQALVGPGITKRNTRKLQSSI